jgi:hypothetical protein
VVAHASDARSGAPNRASRLTTYLYGGAYVIR